jgi:multiple sugar transport system substrate-binding protein
MPQNLSRNQIIIIGIAGIVVLFFVLLFLGVIPGLKTDSQGGIRIGGGNDTAITLWGSANDKEAIQLLIDGFLKIQKGYKIEYTEFYDQESYENALLNAMATGNAPDIFMIHNTWLPKHYNKIAPLPASMLTLSQFQQLFPDVATYNFTGNGQIYALPLYIDTLALIYNKSIINAKGVAVLPTSWHDFQNIIPQLTQINASRQITRPGAAIGGSEKSIDHATDLLNLLLMQFVGNGTGEGADVKGNQLSALNFYTQFSNPSSAYYTWNDNLIYSLDGFANETTAVIFDYASQIPLIKSKNPYLNIGVAPMPQTGEDQVINYANYWGLTVSNQSKLQTIAWNFILYAAANPDASDLYLKSAQKPPALRSLIVKYKDDPDLGIFARQALSANSMYQTDSTAVKKILSNMIELILSGRLDTQKALDVMKSQIQDLNRQ